MFREHTPIEEYKLGDRTVFVKREDLYANLPDMPPLSKLRGIKIVLDKLHSSKVRIVGNFDTRVSKSGQGIASICHYLYPDMNVILGYPRLKNQDGLPPQLKIAESLGAIILPLPASRLSINYYQMRRRILSMGGVMLPHGLPFTETAISVAEEASTVPDELLSGTLVICTGTGTILGGVISGLKRMPNVIGISAGKSIKEQLKRITNIVAEVNPGHLNYLQKMTLLPPIMDYYKECTVDVPFPCHPNYDAKAWFWLGEHIDELKDPILFWDIGG